MSNPNIPAPDGRQVYQPLDLQLQQIADELGEPYHSLNFHISRLGVDPLLTELADRPTGDSVATQDQRTKIANVMREFPGIFTDTAAAEAFFVKGDVTPAEVVDQVRSATGE